MRSEATSGATRENSQLDVSEFVGSGPLQGVNAEAVYDLLSGCPRRNLEAGDQLIRFNRVNPNKFIVLSGELGVYIQEDSSIPLATLSVGETVGEVSALDQEPATASARALTDCEHPNDQDGDALDSDWHFAQIFDPPHPRDCRAAQKQQPIDV